MRTYTNPVLQSQKMLASTVQFSTYNQTPVTRPHRTHALPRETQRYEEQTGPAEIHVPTRGKPPDGPLSQDPTACLQPVSPPPPAFHAGLRGDRPY